MEAFFQFLAELLPVVIFAAAGFLITVVLALLAFGIFALAKRLAWKKTAPGQTGSESAPAPRTFSARLKGPALFLAGLFMLLLIAGVVADRLYFEPVLQWVLQRVKDRGGIEVTYDSVRGRFLSGKVHFKGVQLNRTEHPRSEYSIHAKDFYFDLDMLALAFGKKHIQACKLKHVAGEFTRKIKKKRRKRKRPYVIDELLIEDLTLSYADEAAPGGAVRSEITVEKLHCRDFRSRYKAFDLLFRSQVSAAVDGHPVLFSSPLDRNGHEGASRGSWQTQDFPLTTAAAYSKGASKYITGGRMDIDMTKEPKPGDGSVVLMDWNLHLRDVTVEGPDHWPGALKKITSPAVNFINRKGKDFSLQFTLEIEESFFEKAPSMDTSELWKKLGKVFWKALVKKAVQKRELIKNAAKKGVGKVKSFFKRKFGKKPATGRFY